MKTKKKILIVEDNDNQRVFIKDALVGPDFEAYEFEYHEAETGDNALVLIEKHKTAPFDVIILDHRLPGEFSGIKTLAQAKTITKSLAPVIFMTAYGTGETGYMAWKLGVFSFLDKPVEVEKLRKTVIAALEKPKLKVFLSYAREDAETVKENKDKLLSQGYASWLDSEQLIPGQNWRLEIEAAMKAANVVILFLSSKSLKKRGFIQTEIRMALEIQEREPLGEMYIIPARLDACELPAYFDEIQYVNLYEEGGFDRLIEALALKERMLQS